MVKNSWMRSIVDYVLPIVALSHVLASELITHTVLSGTDIFAFTVDLTPTVPNSSSHSINAAGSIGNIQSLARSNP